jgi:hypothetical protein
MNPMSKYQELSKLASKYAHDTYALRDECQECAARFSAGFVEYLEIPDGYYSYIKLSSDLNVIERNCGFSICPTMVRALDGFWYFGLEIRLQAEGSIKSLDQTITIGVSKKQDNFILKVSNTSFTVDGSSFDEVYKSLYEEDIKELRKPATTVLSINKIGFIQ